MRHLALALVTLSGVAAAVAACSDEITCAESLAAAGATADTPCLAVNARTSTAPERQCFTKPQICPDLSPVRFLSRAVSTATVTNAVPVNLLIENRGEAAMTITSVKVRGDVRCAFKRAQFAPAIGQKIEAGDSFIVRFFYVVPNAVGDDAAAIEIESDAENLPRLVIPVCGKAVTRGTPNDPNQMCPDRTAAEYTECFEEP
jgi:hypothetical protein